MWSGGRNLFMGGKALVVIIYDICDPKSEYFGGICFSVLINWRKKCVNCYDKTLRQRCVIYQNRVNVVLKGHFCGSIQHNYFFRCSLPKAMSISRSEILGRKKKEAETEVEKLPSVKVVESVS